MAGKRLNLVRTKMDANHKFSGNCVKCSHLSKALILKLKLKWEIKGDTKAIKKKSQIEDKNRRPDTCT